MSSKLSITINGTYRGREYRSFKDAQFLKIFFHNYSNLISFKDEKDAMHCNEKDKYSILSELDSSYRINGKYEFLLVYPLLGLYNWWRQSKLPFDNIEVSDKKADGYEDVDIKMTERYWGGLVKTSIDDRNYNKKMTLIDGSAGHWNWFYSIGSYDCITGNNASTNEVYLYIRIPLFSKYFLLTRSCYRQRFSFLVSLMVLLVC